MILSSLSKLGIGGGTILGTLTLVEVAPTSNSTEQNRTQFKKQIGTITSVDDIEFLESQNGCTISYIQAFGQNKAYRARKYLSEVAKDNPKGIDWNDKVVWAANYYKERCKPGEFIPFAYNGDSPQKFFIKEEENHKK